MSAPAQQTVDPVVQRMLTLVTLHRQARHKKKISDLSFLMVNQTFNIIPYRHCIFWRCDGERLTVEAASGLVHLDANGPYAIWLSSVISRLLREQARKTAPKLKPDEQKSDESYAKSYLLTAMDCPESDREHWSEWASTHALLLTMQGADEKVHYGLWLDRDEPFDDTEVAFVEDLGDSYAHVLQGLDRGISRVRLKRPGRTKMIMISLAGCAVMLMPTRMSVTAPAEVVARNPLVVSVPFDGVIESVLVKPNQAVKKGDLLVTMESTVLRNKSEMMGQELATAQEAMTKTEREALRDPTKLPELNVLRAQIREKEADKKYADELLSRAQIVAEQDGIAIFPDANALRGKPAQTGEQVMALADPDDSEMLIRVPVDGMITLDQEAPVSFFLNVSPLNSRKAKIETISYQATADHDGLLTYKVRAQFEEEAGKHPRVGWTGSAKLYGEKTLFAFNILRRPIVTIRRKLGI